MSGRRKRRSMQIWEAFVQLPGAAVDGKIGIASEHALNGLVKVIKYEKPSHILEVGAGIGTLTYTTLSTAEEIGLDASPSFTLYIVENNEFCIDQLAVNLAEFSGKYNLIAATDALKDGDLTFDLIIVDGGGDLPNDMGVMDLSGLLNPHGVIFVEGGRQYQRTRISEDWYPDREHCVIKIEAARKHIESEVVAVKARNKAYHLFWFEPSQIERLYLRSWQMCNRVQAKLARFLVK